jgi:hypothetical protein
VSNTFNMWEGTSSRISVSRSFSSNWLSDIRLKHRGKGLIRAVLYIPNLLKAASTHDFPELFGTRMAR